MASQDFIELMTKLHVEKYSMFSKTIAYDGLGTRPLLKVTVVLKKRGEQITIQSSEIDFFEYVVQLRGVADTTGEHKFIRLKNLDQYWTDTEHLIDKDCSKIKKAVEGIKSRRFTLEYSPTKLIEEFLENKNNVKDKKFLPLKRDFAWIGSSVSSERLEPFPA